VRAALLELEKKRHERRLADDGGDRDRLEPTEVVLSTPRRHRGALALAAGALALAFVLSCKGGRPRAESSDRRADADASAPAPEAEPTYWNRVAGILETHCTKCHAEGGIAPMALGSFEQAKTHAGSIAFQTRERHMPPWLPETSTCAPLEHSRALAQAEIDALARWAAAGAPEGRREDHRPPIVRRTYAALPPDPDRVVLPSEAYTPKKIKGDDYHCFVIDPAIQNPEMIVGLRIAPGATQIVHHVVLYEVRASAVARVNELDEKEPGPGYTCFGGIGVAPTVRPGNLAKGELVDFDAQMIVGWAPGGGATDIPGAPTALPKGTGLKLAPGSRLVMQVHYSFDNFTAGMKDRTRVDMWFAKKDEPRRQAVWVPLLQWGFRVPPNVGPDDPRATAKADITLPLPLTVLGVAPHMHLRGKQIRVDATKAVDDPSSSCLLDVPRWDFHHQEAYWLTTGTSVSRASVSCTWDNRASAQPVTLGKRKPPRELHWGEGTDDEMCLAFLYATL